MRSSRKCAKLAKLCFYCFCFVSLRLTILEIDKVKNSKCGFIYLLYVYSAHVPKFDDDRIDTLGVVRENA